MAGTKVEIKVEMTRFRIVEWNSVLRPKKGEKIQITGGMECEAKLPKDTAQTTMLLDCSFDVGGEERERFFITGRAVATFSLSERDDERMNEVIKEQCVPMVQEKVTSCIARVTEDMGFAPVRLGG